MAGFTLKITNPPAGATLWKADFAGSSWDYDPVADSGWLGVDETWEYPSDPLGCTTLFIGVIDADNNILISVENLGPIEDGIDYTFDCSAAGLVGPAPSILDSMVMMMIVVMMMTMMMKTMEGV